MIYFVKMFPFLVSSLYFLGALCSTYEAKSVHQRLAGGQPASPGDFPFVAKIAIHTTNGSAVYIKAGVILNENWILSSHIRISEGVDHYTVTLGRTSLSKAEAGEINVDTSVYVSHPLYNTNTFANDIQLIRLPNPISFTTTIKPVSTPTKALEPNVSNLVSVGWGRNNSADNSVLASELRYVHLTTITNEECKKYYSAVPNTTICTIGKNSEGICGGDFGGPLISYEDAPRATLVGIASFYSAKGCDYGDPSGFTDVYKFNSWILHTITSYSTL